MFVAQKLQLVENEYERGFVGLKKAHSLLQEALVAGDPKEIIREIKRISTEFSLSYTTSKQEFQSSIEDMLKIAEEMQDPEIQEQIVHVRDSIKRFNV